MMEYICLTHGLSLKTDECPLCLDPSSAPPAGSGAAAVAEQPIPHGNGGDIASLVQQDIEARAAKGKEAYGERLKPNNGRNALWDAYQEALDLAMYLRQSIEEQRQ